MSELADAILEINKAKKREFVVKGNVIPGFNAISTGPFILDYALHGGIPEGLAVEIYGLESSGKSTISARITTSIQSKHPEKSVLWIDAEKTYDANWVEKHGVDTSRLVVVQPETGEEAIDVITAMMEVWEIAGVVVDSIPALVPQDILAKSAGDDTMAALPRLVTKLCAKILGAWGKERARNHWVTVILINQWRSKVGFVMGDPRKLPGGNQLQYLVTTKLEIKGKEVKGKDARDIDVTDVIEHSFSIAKRKSGNAISSGVFRMVVNPDHRLAVGAYDEFETIVTFARDYGFVTGGGSSYKLQDCEQRFKKLAEIASYLEANEDECLKLKQMIISLHRVEKGLKPLPPDGFLLDWNARDNLDMVVATSDDTNSNENVTPTNDATHSDDTIIE